MTDNENKVVRLVKLVNGEDILTIIEDPLTTEGKFLKAKFPIQIIFHEDYDDENEEDEEDDEDDEEIYGKVEILEGGKEDEEVDVHSGTGNVQFSKWIPITGDMDYHIPVSSIVTFCTVSEELIKFYSKIVKQLIIEQIQIAAGESKKEEEISPSNVNIN